MHTHYIKVESNNLWYLQLCQSTILVELIYLQVGLSEWVLSYSLFSPLPIIAPMFFVLSNLVQKHLLLQPNTIPNKQLL
jgi:hypothetical protein